MFECWSIAWVTVSHSTRQNLRAARENADYTKHRGPEIFLHPEGWQAQSKCAPVYVTQNYPPCVRFRALSLQRTARNGTASVPCRDRRGRRARGWNGGDRTRRRELRVGQAVWPRRRPVQLAASPRRRNFASTDRNWRNRFFSGFDREEFTRSTRKIATYFVYVNSRIFMGFVCILINPTGIFVFDLHDGIVAFGNLTRIRLAFKVYGNYRIICWNHVSHCYWRYNGVLDNGILNRKYILRVAHARIHLRAAKHFENKAKNIILCFSSICRITFIKPRIVLIQNSGVKK